MHHSLPVPTKASRRLFLVGLRPVNSSRLIRLVRLNRVRFNRYRHHKMETILLPYFFHGLYSCIYWLPLSLNRPTGAHALRFVSLAQPCFPLQQKPKYIPRSTKHIPGTIYLVYTPGTYFEKLSSKKMSSPLEIFIFGSQTALTVATSLHSAGKRFIPRTVHRFPLHDLLLTVDISGGGVLVTLYHIYHLQYR